MAFLVAYYIGLSVAEMATTCAPLFKLLQKNELMICNNDCQIAFDKINTYLLNHSVLVPSVLGRPLLMYLAVHETYMGCLLGQHDELVKKEQTTYYLRRNLPTTKRATPLWRKLDVLWCGRYRDCVTV